MKAIRLTAPAPIRWGLILAVVFCWIAGCDAAAKHGPRQNQSSKGAVTMNQTQAAVKAAVPIPAIDAVEPAQLKIATFAAG